MKIEHITAHELIEAEVRAFSNCADKPRLKYIRNELKKLPETEERLAFELLKMASKDLERQVDPMTPALCAFNFRTAISVKRMPEYVTLIEKIIISCFDLMGQLNIIYDDGPFALTLGMALATLYSIDYPRFRIIVDALRQNHIETKAHLRWKILSESELSKEEKKEQIEKNLRAFRKEINAQMMESMESLKSRLN